MNFPPKSLQNTLIFYITGIIVFTSGFSAVVTLSRENILLYQEALSKAIFCGRLLRDPGLEYLVKSRKEPIEEIRRENENEMSHFLITLYDRNWWAKWGDTARIPSEGFPADLEKTRVALRSGLAGESVREIYVPIYDGEAWVGTIGLGIPEFSSAKARNSIQQVLMTTLANILLGAALAIFIAQIILRPLNYLLEGIEAVKRGDYGQRVQVQGEGELALLGQTFNLMASSLQEKIRESLERTRILDEKVQELWEIYELTKAMGFSLRLQQILERFQERAQTLSFSSYGQTLLCLSDSGRLEVRVETPSFPLISRRDHDACLERCLNTGETIEHKNGKHTLLYIPLLSGSLVQGILFLGKQGDQSYSEGVRRFLETIAPLGGSLIENAKLYQHVLEIKNYVQNVLDSVDSGVATVDGEGKMVSVNEAFKRLLEIPEHPEALGKPVRDFLAGVADPVFVQTFEDMALGRMSRSGAGGLAPRQEFQIQLPRRGPRTIQLRASRLMGGQEILGRVVVADDVTALREFERRMLDSEKWVVLGRLAASVAHEIRNPLVAIRSLVEVIGEDLQGENARHIQVVIGEVKRLNMVLEQLLHLSRAERTELREVSVNQLLEEMLVLVRHEASRRNIHLKKQWSEQEIYAKIDPEKMKQAALNIMLNGIQAMDKGGTLSIALSVQKPPAFSEIPGKPSIQLEFADEGEGIPPENLERLYDPFFTTRTQGTGLGLAITKKIVDLHNGTIAIDSKLGKGTRFILTIPQYGQDDPEGLIT